MKKVLITGANGQLGKELSKVFHKDWQVIETDSDTLDITNPVQVKDFLAKEKPNWVINSAAYTDVEGCAKDPDKANLINALGNKNLADAAKEINSKLLYISTNEVFDGEKATAYVESDLPKPINPYSVSKLQGEKFAQEVLGDNCLIIRTAWLYGPESKVNFPNKIITRAKELGELAVVDDEISTPTFASDLAKWIKELVDKNEGGVYHLVNDGFASRYDWAEQILAESKVSAKLNRSKLENYPRLSTPPKRSVLSNQKAKDLGLVFRPWQEASSEYLKALSA